MIRGKLHKCPFGLKVPFGCKNAGGCPEDSNSKAADLMIPLHDLEGDELERAAQYNLDLLFLVDEPKKCPYADKIMDDRKSVDCKYDKEGKETAVGIDGINSGKDYPHIMVGQSAKTQYGQPKEYNDYYSDDNNTNIYYGIYSLIG